jgi:DMSO reductase family type II enzyme heme b subunit
MSDLQRTPTSTKHRFQWAVWSFVGCAVILSGGALMLNRAHAQEEKKAASAGPSYRPEKPTDEQLKRGSKVFFKECVWCHGPEGAGDGPGALRLWPRPRNFNAGTFKIRTTASGELPTDNDLFLTVTNGLPGSAMPAWDGILTEEERKDVVAFVKTKMVKDRDFQDPDEEFHVVSFDGQVPSSAESIKRGQDVFLNKGKCVQCHGPEARGNGNLTQKDDWGFPIFPADLHQCWNFRGNRRDPYNPKNIFREVTTGLNGTPMPSFVDVLTVQDRWDVANFVIAQCPKVKIDPITVKPTINFVLTSDHVDGPLPTTVDDPKWNGQEPHFIGLGGQITRKPQNFNRRIEDVWVKSLYNNDEIAFLLEWDDRNESHAQAGELPMPPLNVADLTIPVAYYANKMVFDEVKSEFADLYPGLTYPEPVIYNDAVAIQFPAEWQKLVPPERPFFIHGDPIKPVDIWKWESNGTAIAYTGHGIDGKTGADEIVPRQTPLKAEGVQFKNGRWYVILTRPLKTDDKENDVQFEVNKYIPIAFQAWDGDNGEAGARMALSAWYYVVLKPLTPTSAYVYPPFVMGGVLIGMWWVVKKTKSMQNGNGHSRAKKK